MAQNRSVMAFRKRLKSYGYSDISIKLDADDDDYYIVRAVEPLAGVAVETRLDVVELHRKFRRERGGIPTSK